MTFAFIDRVCSDLPVVVCCRVMKVSTSGFYAWRTNPIADRDLDDAHLTNTIVDVHRMSRRSYGSPRVHAELRLGEGIRCSRKRVERLMRQAGVQGIHRRRGRGCTHRDPAAEPSDDLVNRVFDPTEADRLWVTDVTEHRSGNGKVYLAVGLDAFSRRVMGWSIADHIRSELVVDAVQMAIWRRQPPEGQVVAHSDHGAQYTSWAFGRRLRSAGLLGSMGSIGDCFDNSVALAVTGMAMPCTYGELLRDPAARAARRAPLDDTSAAGHRHLRLDRILVQPAPPTLLLQDAQPHRLRTSPHPRRYRGMIPTTNPSAGPGGRLNRALGVINVGDVMIADSGDSVHKNRRRCRWSVDASAG